MNNNRILPLVLKRKQGQKDNTDFFKKRRMNMLHQPVHSDDETTDLALNYRTRIGVLFFLLFALVYVVFVVINLVSPLIMEKVVLFGMNLAVTYGIGLILFAFLLALIYNQMCSKKELALKQAALSGKKA